MSSIVTSEGIVHYEVEGRGKPVVFLHGWLNSWDVWRDTMIALSSLHRYKIYALDFWGFGDSAKRKAPPFQIPTYVSMVHQFLDIMGIEKAPIIGHSMGGTVAMSLALEHPACVEKVAVVGSPMDGRSLNILLKLAGMRSIAILVWRIPYILRFIVWLMIARDGPKVHRMIERDLSRTTLEAFFRSIDSLRRTDLRPRLREVRMPALGIFGRRDNIVDPRQAEVMRAYIPHAQVWVLERSRHFPMIDEPEQFNGIVVDFLEQ